MFSSDDIDELAPTSTPAVFVSVCPIHTMEHLTASLFWAEPVSVFGSLQLTMPVVVHLC
jgi:hypothetical protein